MGKPDGKVWRQLSAYSYECDLAFTTVMQSLDPSALDSISFRAGWNAAMQHSEETSIKNNPTNLEVADAVKSISRSFMEQIPTTARRFLKNK